MRAQRGGGVDEARWGELCDEYEAQEDVCCRKTLPSA